MQKSKKNNFVAHLSLIILFLMISFSTLLYFYLQKSRNFVLLEKEKIELEKLNIELHRQLNEAYEEGRLAQKRGN